MSPLKSVVVACNIFCLSKADRLCLYSPMFLGLFLCYKPLNSIMHAQCKHRPSSSLLLSSLFPISCSHRIAPTSSSWTSLLCTQQNIYWNIDLLKNLWNYLSNEWSFILNRVQTWELCPFHFGAACCPENFRVHDLRCFSHNRLLESPIDLILDSLEPELHGAFEYPKICC